VRIETGMYEIRTTEGYFFLMSRIDFHYKGRWIPPENSTPEWEANARRKTV